MCYKSLHFIGFHNFDLQLLQKSEKTFIHKYEIRNLQLQTTMSGTYQKRDQKQEPDTIEQNALIATRAKASWFSFMSCRVQALSVLEQRHAAAVSLVRRIRGGQMVTCNN